VLFTAYQYLVSCVPILGYTVGILCATTRCCRKERKFCIRLLRTGYPQAPVLAYRIPVITWVPTTVTFLCSLGVLGGNVGNLHNVHSKCCSGLVRQKKGQEAKAKAGFFFRLLSLTNPSQVACVFGSGLKG
jgi:hypothetical protein